MSIFLPGLPDLPTGLYFLSVDNSQKDKTVYTIGRHLRHSPPNFEMIRGLDIFYSGQPVSVPADDVRPVVRGVWVKNGWSIRCSICGYDMPFATRNFCPNCGADMREAPHD